MDALAATMPIGRDAEQRAIDRALERAAGGAVGVCLSGEAGIGKSCLWQWTVDRAVTLGIRVLAARPAEAESTLAFVGLCDLLAGDLDGVLAGMPRPQARALEIALLRREPGDGSGDLRAVSVGCVTALRLFAAAQPVVVAIDDAHWLDASTRAVLAFACRRLGDARVSWLVSIRSASPEPLEIDRALAPERLQRIALGPLGSSALEHLIRDRVGTAVPRPALMRIERASGGNPYYAIELARAIAGAPERRLVDPLPIPGSLKELPDRLAALPADVRAACLLAAAASRPTLELLARVASAEAVEAAVAADVLVVDDRGQVSFRHPLLAAAAYRQASLRDRRRAHEQLARETTDPEERGRHLALVSDGPDPVVARTLDAAADAARRRGATYAAAELAQLARDRTLAVSDRARRSLTLADDLFQLGDTSGAREAAEQALLGTTATCGRSRLLLARIEWLTGSGGRALELAESALAIADTPLMEAEILTEVAFLSRADRIKGAASARRAVELLERLGDDAARPLLARALTALVFVESDLGLPLSPGLVARARALTPRRERERVSDRIGYYLGTILFDYDDLDGARPLLEESLAAARDEGDEGSLTSVLDQLSQLEVLAGAWTKARGLAAEQARVAELTGQEAQRLWGVETLAAIDAREGDLDAAAARLDEVLAGARKLRDPMTIAFAQRTASFVALTQGDAAAACAASAETTELTDAIGVFSSSALRHEPDHAEALVELGRFDDAARVIARLEERGRRAELPWAAATAARCGALLAAATGDLDAASAAIADALRGQQRLAMPFELARTHLVAGRIHRRRKEKRAARESFERAGAMFAELGSRAWAERAREEARRLGGRTPAPYELTPTERLVADLAAAGLTNPEIAARLFMSRKTVEFNLGKVYRKLGVRGRTELAVHASNSGDLPGSERPLAP